MRNNIELLAPAGDVERAKVAIDYGANAIYLGGKAFSLRSRASNFDIDDIETIVNYAKPKGVAVHVTVNMIPHDSDLQGYSEYLQTLQRIGVTAIIVASLSVVRLARKVAPQLEVHLSTQCSSTNAKAIEFYQNLGVNRVVFAREVTLPEIETINKQVDIETEAFVHGGMCVNYSGRCTLSNFMTNRDANRGGCAQSCRWKYHLFNNNQELSDPACLFSMSSKDLAAPRAIYSLMNANVASLKIEGRMKTAYYVATVVQTYRRLIDEVAACGHQLSDERLAYYENELKKAENRPTGEGFYGKCVDESMHLYGINGAGVTHDFVGLVLDIKDNWMLVQSRNVFCVNDTIEFFGPYHEPISMTIEQIVRDSDHEVLQRSYQPMENVWVKANGIGKVNDMMRRIRL